MKHAVIPGDRRATRDPCRNVSDVGSGMDPGSSLRYARDDPGSLWLPQANSLEYCRGCERRYWFGALTLAPSSAAACQGQRGL